MTYGGSVGNHNGSVYRVYAETRGRRFCVRHKDSSEPVEGGSDLSRDQAQSLCDDLNGQVGKKGTSAGVPRLQARRDALALPMVTNRSC